MASSHALSSMSAQRFLFQRNFAPFYFQGFAVHQDIGYLFVRRFNDSAECLPGNIHSGRCIFLIQKFVVRQANRFKFIQVQNDLFKLRRWDSPGLK